MSEIKVTINNDDHNTVSSGDCVLLSRTIDKITFEGKGYLSVYAGEIREISVNGTELYLNSTNIPKLSPGSDKIAHLDSRGNTFMMPMIAKSYTYYIDGKTPSYASFNKGSKLYITDSMRPDYIKKIMQLHSHAVFVPSLNGPDSDVLAALDGQDYTYIPGSVVCFW